MSKAEEGTSRPIKPKQSLKGYLPQNLSTAADSEKSFHEIRSGIEARLSSIDGQKTQKPKKAQTGGANSRSRVSQNALSLGKKRNHQGEIVNGFSINTGAGGDGSRSGSQLATLEDEIQALGGSKEDLELIGDVESASEYEEIEPKPSKTDKYSRKSQDLATGMNNILKEISLVQRNTKELGDADDGLSDSSVASSVDQKATSIGTSGRNRFKTPLKCEVRPDWFAMSSTQEPAAEDQRTTPSKQLIDELHSFAKSLLQQDNELYRQASQSTSSQAFYNTVISSGTLSDKISALTLAVQESPVHNVKSLETLIGLSKKRSRSQAVDVLRALKDLFAQGSLLPSNRKLYTFSAQPAIQTVFGERKAWRAGDKLPREIEERDLILWAYEDWVKEQYFEVIKTLEGWCNDEIEFAKSKAISYVYELLKERPEQESNLLRLLVNKLGDPVKKIASQASYLIMQLLGAHPAMKRVVVSAIEKDFVFRPAQSLHGQYYAIVTLNQTVLSDHEEDIVEQLLRIYFSLFSSLLKKVEVELKPGPEQKASARRGSRPSDKIPSSGQAQTEELQEKLTSALLTGVNRAYPYVGTSKKGFEDHIDTLFKIAHSANFNTSVQAMLLIQQLSSSHQPSNDRFFRLLYDSLLDPRLLTASKHQLYLNLLHRALKADMNTKRVKAFVKRILQILSLHEPSFSCGMFFLLKDLESTFPGLASLVDQAEDVDADEEHFQDVDAEFNENSAAPQEDGRGNTHATDLKYDGHKRAPEYANAENSCAWEVLPFLAHYHPSVVVSAEHYIRHEKLPGKPDLTLHTVIHFLDRFVYRNAKLSETKWRGSSIMQPMASDNSHAVLINRASGPANRLPVNSEEFKTKERDEVAADDVFFHRYFTTTAKDNSKKNKRKGKAPVEIGADEEDAVWQAMLESAPDLEGAESDDDLDMSDLESEMDKQSSQSSDQAFADADSDLDVEGLGSEFIGDGSDASQPNSDLEMLQESDESTEDRTGPTIATGGAAKRKSKLKSLPVFASVDDYARLLDGDGTEDDR